MLNDLEVEMNMSVPEQELRAMRDREAIRDLAIAYYEGQWRDDPQAIVNTFTPDGTITVRNGALNGSAASGHVALLEFYSAGLVQMRPRTFGHNHVIDLVDERRATGRLCIELLDSHDFRWVAAVMVDDEYRKLDSGWKIYRRDATLHMGSAR